MKWHFQKLPQKGVTLVEILVVMGLLSGMLVVIATIFTSAADAQLQSKSHSSVLTDSRFILARLNYDISRASSVQTPANLGDTSNSLALTIHNKTYTYQLNGANLELTDPDGTATVNGSNTLISNMSFQKLGTANNPPTIKYTFTLKSKTKTHHGQNTQTLTSTAGLRP
jgi:type II secretory pathway pseudopilin PulG